jgi:adenosylcobinamide kinase/adenosylcobinamide-phosphate guanylyltransferase
VSRHLAVILGGTRSGKSRFGLRRATALARGEPVTYLATAQSGDPELDERIAGHRRERPADWPTVEVGRDLAVTIRALPGDATLLLDGLTLWLSLRFGDEPQGVDDALAAVDDARAAIREHRGAVVVVSDEIGLGLVPMDALARAFRDALGIAHQRLVADSDEAWFMVAGRALRLEEPGEPAER